MEERVQQNAFVIEQFNLFYQALLNAKADIITLSKTETDIPQTQQEQNVADLNNRLTNKLTSLFGLSHEKDWSHGREFYREAQYVLAVLADETLINTEWFGRELWKHHLLEFSLFKTNNAGDLFFEKLDSLLKDGNQLNAGLVEVYLRALILGFQGKYRGTKTCQAIINQYKRECFIFIYGREYDSMDAKTPIFKPAYDATISRPRLKLLPIIDRFIVTVVTIVVVYLGVNQIIWRTHTQEVRRLADEAVTKISHLTKMKIGMP